MYSKTSTIIYFIGFFTSLALIVGGFLVPPTGVIDGSVLSAVGELALFVLIWKLPEYIHAAKSIKMHTPKGTEIEIEGKEQKDKVS